MNVTIFSKRKYEIEIVRLGTLTRLNDSGLSVWWITERVEQFTSLLNKVELFGKSQQSKKANMKRVLSLQTFCILFVEYT